MPSTDIEKKPLIYYDELKFKLLKRGCIGEYIGEFFWGIRGV